MDEAKADEGRSGHIRNNLSDSIFTIEASQTPVHILGVGDFGEGEGQPWTFTAYRRGAVVFKQTIPGSADLCAARFVDALVRHLRNERDEIAYILCERDGVLDAPSFLEACREAGIIVDGRAPAIRRT